MTLALILLGISFIGMGFVVLNRARVVEGGEFYVPVKDSWNKSIENFFEKIKFFVTEFPKQAGIKCFHFLVIKCVELARKMKSLIYPKISHIMDTVKGKDVPKVKGKASEFLRSIRVDGFDDNLK